MIDAFREAIGGAAAWGLVFSFVFLCVQWWEHYGPDDPTPTREDIRERERRAIYDQDAER
jgi:hypothetical protein